MQPRFILSCLVVLAASTGRFAAAQEAVDAYPSKPVTIVVPFAAGTSIDQAFRLYAKSVGERTGKQFVLTFSVGAAGTIGAAAVAKAAPDGYTLVAATSAITITPFVYKNLSYDHIADFAPITLMVKQPYVLLVHPAGSFKDVREYIAYAKANPGAINYATAGAGSSTHLPGALLHYMTGTDVSFVHYKAATQRMLDLVSGRVHVTGATLTAGLPHMKSQKLRALGLASAQRSPQHPDLPTVAEQGVPGYEYYGWNGLAAPARTPAAVIEKLHAMFVAAGQDPQVVKAMTASSTMLVNGTPDEFRKHIVTETERWRAMIKATNMQLDAGAS